MRVARHVDQQMTEQAIDQPGRAMLLARKLLTGNLQFVQAVVPGFVHPRRLTRRPDERAGKQIRQRRMIVPIRHQAAEQVGTPEHRALGRRRPAQHKVVAAAGAGMPAVEHELLGPQPALSRFFVQRRGVEDQFLPVAGRLNVHFQHARVGRQLEVLQAVIVRRRIAFQDDRHLQFGGGLLDRGDQTQIILEPLDRRHENVQPSLARFDAQRRADQSPRRLARASDTGPPAGQAPDIPASPARSTIPAPLDRHPTAPPCAICRAATRDPAGRCVLAT